MNGAAELARSESFTHPIEIVGLTPSDFARWDAFVDSAPQASFFHRAGWKTVFEQAFGYRTHFLLAQVNGVIEGVLPLAEIKGPLFGYVFGHSLTSIPFADYGGIAATTERAREALDKAAQVLALRLGVDCLEYRNRVPEHEDWPKSELYFLFRKAIDPDVEKNLLAIPRKQRAMVRKGISNGLLSEIDNNVDRLFPLYADNVHRHGTPPLSKKYFALLKAVFGKDCEILIITKDGQSISGVMSFYFRDEVIVHHPGDLPAARALAANDFKYWEVMRRACERGCRVFDYGRSKRGTGPFDFKKNWGFEPTPLHYEYKLVRATEVPEKNPLNPKYQLVIATWRRLPIGVANWLGPHIVKYLG
ncbi:MAG: FemAB family XrtA/PEP-CTERM system-associated protein [Pseudomonadota bacterium]